MQVQSGRKILAGNENPERTGERLRLWRLSQGMTQQEIATKLGISVGYLCRLEKGVANLGAEALMKLESFGLPRENLLGGVTGPPPESCDMRSMETAGDYGGRPEGPGLLERVAEIVADPESAATVQALAGVMRISPNRAWLLYIREKLQEVSDGNA
jgi:DNA-binding XRE family transcriptional regulator